MRRTQRSGEVKTADLRFFTCVGQARTRASDARHLEQRISGDFRPQLSRGDGIDGTSVYLAFGSKEKLFEQAFQLHLQEGAPGLRSLREQSTGKEAIRCMLKNGVTVLPRETDSQALACLCRTLWSGVSVHILDGVPKPKLFQAIDLFVEMIHFDSRQSSKPL